MSKFHKDRIKRHGALLWRESQTDRQTDRQTDTQTPRHNGNSGHCWRLRTKKEKKRERETNLCPSFIKIASNVTELCSGESHKQTDRHTNTTKIVVTVGTRKPREREGEREISLCPSFIKITSNVTELCSGESHKQTDRQTDNENSGHCWRLRTNDTNPGYVHETKTSLLLIIQNTSLH